MKTKLKYLKLFEGISPSDIPYSSIYNYKYKSIDDYMLDILVDDTKIFRTLPEIYNQLTNEVNGCIFIGGNSKLELITGFNNLTEIGTYIKIFDNPKLTQIKGFSNLNKIGGYLLIQSNPNLTHISGFNSLTKIYGHLFLRYNPKLIYVTGFDNLTESAGNLYVECLDGSPKLISMSIPYTIIKSVGEVSFSYSEFRFNTAKELINSPDTIKDCIDKFDPAIHPDVVVKQIIENLELWGEPDTIEYIINHILSKGDYWEYIPESIKQYVEEKYHHLYNAKYANTGARGIAKMNTGRYLGMF